MDNITHSLIGVAVARAVLPRERGTKLSRAAMGASLLASNAPDGDFLVHYLPGADSLTYLLHHRGITHTVVGVPLLALLCVFLAALGARYRPATRREQGALLGVGLLAGGFHVAADFLNDYGVHPFSPFWNRWFYGDTLFIVEPSLWLALLPLAIRETSARSLKILLMLLWGGVFALYLWSPFSSVWVAAALFLWGWAWALLQRRFPSAWPAVAGVALVVSVFGVSSKLARSQVREELARAVPSETVSDIAMTATPANPLCWRTIAVSREGDLYRARIGQKSLLSSVVSPEACFPMPAEQRAPVAPPLLSGSPDGSLVWSREFQGSVSDLRGYAKRFCGFSAFLSYSRIPYWEELGSSGLMTGDLRYDRGRSGGFTSLVFDTMACPPWLVFLEPPFDR